MVSTFPTNVEITIGVHQKIKDRNYHVIWQFPLWVYILEENENTNSKRYMYPNSSVIYSRQDMNASVQKTNG